MNKIIWTYKHFLEGFEGHDLYNKHSVVAICPQPDGFCYLFTGGGDYIHDSFATKEEAFQFITQSNKIAYAKVFDVNYELVYADPQSDEWDAAYEKWEDFLHNILRMKEYTELPWWKRLFKKFKWGEK